MAGKEKIVEYRGCESIYVARVTADDSEEYTCDTPQYLAGASEISRTIESDTQTKYYDNGPAIQVSAVSAPELTLSVSALTNKKLAYITGYAYDTTLDALDLGDITPVDVALMYKYQMDNGDASYVVFYKGRFSITGYAYDTTLDALDLGDITPVDVALMYKYQMDNGDASYVVFYKGRFSIPEGSYATIADDAGSGTGCELTYKASKTTHAFTATGKQGIGQEYLCPSDDLTKAKANLSSFFDRVETPDTIEARKPTSTE